MIVKDVGGFGFYGDLKDDQAAVLRAADLLEQATKDAEQIAADNDTFTGRTKAKITGVDVDSLVAYAKTMRSAANSMRETANRLAADPNLAHARAVDFIRSAAAIADNKALSESAARNSLVKMAVDVGAATIEDVKKKILFPGLGLAAVAGAVVLWLRFGRKKT